MAETELTIEAPDGPMRTFVAHPDGDGPFPVAVIYMDAAGYREQLKEHARRFASDGYYVVVPDLFHRLGENVTFDMQKMFEEQFQGPESAAMFDAIARLQPEMVESDVEALLATVAEDDAASAGPKVCLGYCMGARFALHTLATRPDEFVAASAVHPASLVGNTADSPHHELAAIRGELYVGFADNDETSPPEAVKTFRETMERENVEGEVEVLPNAYHGYSMADLPVYDRDAAERHFAKTLEIWRRNLNKESVSA